MTVTFLGCGYLGLTYAAVFAAAGIKTYAVEPNPKRLEPLKRGESFFFEEGLDELIAHGLKTGNLIPTDSYKLSVSNSDIVFSSVGTPENPDGSPNLDYIFMSANEAIKYLRPGSVFAQKSTVPVGTGRKIIEIMKKAKSKATYVSAPEFLAEGTSVRDVLYYDRLVVGSEGQKATKAILDLHAAVDKKRDEIAKLAGINPVKRKDERVLVSIESAELIKASANSFLALKISFANSIAKLSDAAGADILEVMDGIGIDERIGRAFLNAGRGYGGGCFPKDVSGLIHSANDHGVDLSIMVAAQDVNESMPGYIVNKAKDSLGSLEGKKVAVLGLAFKAGTSDARKSPGAKIANTLDKAGALVSAFDPHANKEAESEVRKSVCIVNSLDEAVADAEAVFITTEWPEFKKMDLKNLASNISGKAFIDAMNIFDSSKVKSAGLQYIGVGRNGD